MQATIAGPTGFYNLAKAIAVTKEMQEADPDWEYRVVDCMNGLGRIDVFDEDGELIEQGFLL